MTAEKWMAVSVVANKLNVSAATVYRLIDGKFLESRRVGVKGCTQVSESSVKQFVHERAEEE
jgi:excisionase family DNA binding protein